MLRGVERVIANEQARVGRFYLNSGYGDPWLFLCAQKGDEEGGDHSKNAIVFAVGEKIGLHLSEIPDHGPLVALGDVHVRVDAASINGHEFSTSVRPGMFLVHDDTPIVCVPSGRMGWILVDITNGRFLPQRPERNWMAFTRWSLVTENAAGDEVTLVSFDGIVPSAS